MAQFFVGQAVTATIAIVDVNGAPYDPPNVYAWSVSPTLVRSMLSVVKLAGVGNYKATFVPNAPKTWGVQFSDGLNPPADSFLFKEVAFPVFPDLFPTS